jgi:hypothetical protein
MGLSNRRRDVKHKLVEGTLLGAWLLSNRRRDVKHKLVEGTLLGA